MKSFQWGTFAELLEAARFEQAGVEVAYGPAGAHLGRIDLNAQGGTGAVEYLYGDSLRAVLFDCTFDQGRVFHVQDAGWIRLNFGLSIAVEMAFGDKLNVRTAEPSWRFIYLPPDAAAVEAVPPGVRLRWVTVCCRRELLADWAGAHLRQLPTEVAHDGRRGDPIVHRDFEFTPLLQDTTAHMLAASVKGRLRVPYLAAKAHELLVLGLDHMLSRQSARPPVRLTDRDIGALHAARAILDTNLAQPPTVRELSLKFGMNRNKLFYGFKSLFGLSISQHLHDRRVAEGHRLLTTTNEPLGEIAARVGFQYQCNFSTAFRTRYGYAPSTLRKSLENQ